MQNWEAPLLNELFQRYKDGNHVSLFSYDCSYHEKSFDDLLENCLSVLFDGICRLDLNLLSHSPVQWNAVRNEKQFNTNQGSITRKSLLNLIDRFSVDYVPQGMDFYGKPVSEYIYC
jgi:hypothetical protein